MNKRILSLLMSLCLLLTPALATQDTAPAETSPAAGFVRTRVYEGQFSDLTADHPFYANVSALYEYGIAQGRADGAYGLSDQMTVGHAVIFAARVRSLYRTGDAEAGPEAHVPAAVGLKGTARTYAPYLWYLQAEGVLDNSLDTVLDSVATRAQTAHVLANLLPEEILPPVNESLITQAYASRRRISDVTEYTPYYQDILKLYRCGISVGSDAAGSFLPEAAITRGAAAAMLTRLVDPALRLTPAWDLSDLYSAQGVTFSDLVKPGTYIAAPNTAAQYDEVIRYMLSRGENTLGLKYPAGVTESQIHQILDNVLIAVKRYCEQGYNSAACEYTNTGSVVLQFSSVAEKQTEAYRAATLEYAIALHDQLWAEGIITPASTQRETAMAYYRYIAANCVYDDLGDDRSVSHLPYSLFHNGRAVCDGYTGAYNLLLRLEGIECYGLANDEHIWTVAVLDGQLVHIDSTWGDQGAFASEAYFAMTPEQSAAVHAWPQAYELPGFAA